jgi:hypothetical protein
MSNKKRIREEHREVNQRSQTMIKEINDHKIQVHIAVEGIRQELGQRKD